MDFEKRYEKELKVNKLDDEFISDLAEKMAKKRIEALSVVRSENEISKVAIVKHDSRKVYISRIAAAAAVAGLVLGLSYVTRIGTTDAPAPDDFSVTDEYEDFLNAHAETSAVPVPGSVTDPVLFTVPSPVTTAYSDSVSVTMANTDITEISPAEIPVSSPENTSVSESASYSVYTQNISVTAVPHSGSKVPETTMPSLTSSESRHVTSVTQPASETAPVTTEITYPATEATVVSDTVTTVLQVTEPPEETLAPDIPNKPLRGEPVYFSAENISAAPGEVVDVKIDISSGTNIMSSFVLYIKYSNEAFDIINADVSDALPSEVSIRNDNSGDSGYYNLMFYNEETLSREFERDGFIVLKLKIKDDAVPGDYSLLANDNCVLPPLVNYVDEEKLITRYDLIFNEVIITVKENSTE